MSAPHVNLNLSDENDKSTSHSTIPYEIARKVMTQEQLSKLTGFARHKDSVFQSLKSSLKSLKPKSLLLSLIPILEWLPRYKRSFLAGDLIAGMTVAVLAIPQGMAYGLLAGLDPVVGLYMAFFPVLVYVLLGSSRHVSAGTYAVVSMMTSKVVATHTGGDYSNYQVATATTLACGLIQLAMFTLRLGAIASLMSEALVSGFTTASAVHVVIVQSKDLLGIDFPRHGGAFKAIFSVRDIFVELPRANVYTVVISLSCMTFLIVANELLRPIVAKRTKFPLPAELVAVIVYTGVSFALDLARRFGVEVVGEIPTGLPAPVLPPLELVYAVAVDSFAIAIVSYSIVVSMGLICAKKDKSYEVRPNQELLALGAANVLGSCFSCIPLACALSRTMVLYQIGGKTQITAVVSALIILMLLLWLGPLFETLPRCILASIIIVALKSMLWQCKDVKKYYRDSKLDALVWIGTFAVVVIVDIDIGLLVGILLSLFALYMKGLRSFSCVLGRVDDTDIYVDVRTCHKNVSEVQEVKIFRHFGSVNFVTCSGFKKSIFECLKIDYHVLKAALNCSKEEVRTLSGGVRTLIIDLGAVAHIDVRGYRTMLEIRNDLKVLNMNVLLADANHVVYDSIERAVNQGETTLDLFPTVHDAVLSVEKKNE